MNDLHFVFLFCDVLQPAQQGLDLQWLLFHHVLSYHLSSLWQVDRFSVFAGLCKNFHYILLKCQLGSLCVVQSYQARRVIFQLLCDGKKQEASHHWESLHSHWFSWLAVESVLASDCPQPPHTGNILSSWGVYFYVVLWCWCCRCFQLRGRESCLCSL